MGSGDQHLLITWDYGIITDGPIRKSPPATRVSLGTCRHLLSHGQNTIKGL